jgi:hypothetical protein
MGEEVVAEVVFDVAAAVEDHHARTVSSDPHRDREYDHQLRQMEHAWVVALVDGVGGLAAEARNYRE